MIRYIAFLRAINVAGQKLIKMEELARIFASMGFSNVRTYIQSGNVIFDSWSANSAMLRKKVEKVIKKVLGYDVGNRETACRNRRDRETQSFQENQSGRRGDAVRSFLIRRSENNTKVATHFSDGKSRSLRSARPRRFHSVSPQKEWLVRFSNKFVEKELGVLGTTRNWTTVNKILKAGERNGVD
jgi:uncharacterized protein (DUF1697 family)